MSQKNRVLITGSLGFIGRKLAATLKSAEMEVWGIDRISTNENNFILGDLLDEQQTHQTLSRAPQFQTIIHLAALAHGQRPRRPHTCLSVNTLITKFLLARLEGQQPHLVFFSSVAVYGENRPDQPVGLRSDTRPSTEYGLSKKICEQMFLASHLRDIDILRVAPVFDQGHMEDVKKRVFPFGIPCKIRILPPPQYSFCHIDTVAEKVLQIVRRGPSGRQFHHVADQDPYSQQTVATWFGGPALPIPEAIMRPLYQLFRLVPGRRGHALRCLYNKLFRSNIYVPTSEDSRVVPNCPGTSVRKKCEPNVVVSRSES